MHDTRITASPRCNLGSFVSLGYLPSLPGPRRRNCNYLNTAGGCICVGALHAVAKNQACKSLTSWFPCRRYSALKMSPGIQVEKQMTVHSCIPCMAWLIPQRSRSISMSLRPTCRIETRVITKIGVSGQLRSVVVSYACTTSSHSVSRRLPFLRWLWWWFRLWVRAHDR